MAGLAKVKPLDRRWCEDGTSRSHDLSLTDFFHSDFTEEFFVEEIINESRNAPTIFLVPQTCVYKDVVVRSVGF